MITRAQLNYYLFEVHQLQFWKYYNNIVEEKDKKLKIQRPIT